VQPVAGPFFARWRLASHGDTSPCLLVFRATLLFFPAKLCICGPNYPDVNHISVYITFTFTAFISQKRIPFKTILTGLGGPLIPLSFGI
jgi:hypothetical protein